MNGMHGIIFSYEKRNDLRELEEIRSASSVPFGGRYRAVDFSLSNLVNAGVTDVGIVLHGHYQSLLDHLGTGKDWDLSRKRGGLKLLPPFAFKEKYGEGAFRGKMEALAGVRSYLQEIRRDYVALMDGDLVVNLPLTEIFEQHLKSGADITVVTNSMMTIKAEKAVRQLQKEGISAELIDLRTIVPLDTETIIRSVKKTGKLLIVDEGHLSFGITGEIASRIMPDVFYDLDAPIQRMGTADVPLPFSPALEFPLIPDEKKIAAKIREMV